MKLKDLKVGEWYSVPAWALAEDDESKELVGMYLGVDSGDGCSISYEGEIAITLWIPENNPVSNEAQDPLRRYTFPVSICLEDINKCIEDINWE